MKFTSWLEDLAGGTLEGNQLTELSLTKYMDNKKESLKISLPKYFGAKGAEGRIYLSLCTAFGIGQPERNMRDCIV